MGADGRGHAAEGITEDPFVRRVADGLLARLPAMVAELRTRIAVEDHYYAGAA